MHSISDISSILALLSCIANPLETRALDEASPIVIHLLHQLEEADGELGPLHVIEQAAGNTSITVADAIVILRFCPDDAVSLVQQVDPQEEKCVAKDTSR